MEDNNLLSNVLKYKYVIINGLMCILMIAFMYLFAVIVSQREILPLEKEGLEKLYYIQEETRLLTEFESSVRNLEEVENSELILLLEDLADDFLVSDSSHKYFADDPGMVVIGTAVYNNWDAFKKAYLKFIETDDLKEFKVSAETYYNSLNNTVRNVEKYVSVFESKVKLLSIFAFIDVCVVFFLMYAKVKVIGIDEKARIKKEEYEYEKYIDKETEIFNIKKCNEVISEHIDLTQYINGISALVFALYNVNDVEADNLPELKNKFARCLENASAILTEKPFISKYGDYEFLVYAKEVNDEIVQNYINAVNDSVQNSNEETSEKFEISHVVGVAITSEEMKQVAVREMVEASFGDMLNNLTEAKEGKVLEDMEKEQEEVKEMERLEEIERLKRIEEMKKLKEAEEASIADEVEETNTTEEIDEIEE